LNNIQRLIGIAKKVSEGDLSIDYPVANTTEAGPLDETFHFMLTKLIEQKNLETRLNKLERKAIVSEIAAFLAHEIRNPLNLIMLSAYYLEKQFPPREESQRKKFDELIASLKSEVGQLNNVVSDFLSIGKSSVLIKSPCSISGIIDQVTVLVRQQLSEKAIEVHVTGDVYTELQFDQEQIRLAILNLFVNAIAAVPAGGEIQVHGEQSETPPLFTLSVTDSGPGIDENDIGKVFEPYFSKKPGGTGLGLALVKRIIEEHEGSIRAENTGGKGARFIITLPMGQ
jgi:signal transduction histidine kinase